MKQTNHLPCNDCNSSDALSLFEDGHTFCFACNKYHKGETKMVEVSVKTEFTIGKITSIPDRNISESTAAKFCVTTLGNKQIYPYTDREGNHIANKIRLLPKAFAAEGLMSNNLALFGQDKFDRGGKAITIFEGELDALSGYELTGSLYPCVSIPNGSGSAVNSIKHNLEYLESFEKIVLCFDNDEPGKKAISEIIPLFSFGKVRIMRLELKDASEYLQANKHRDFIKRWFDAQPWTPDGIVCSSNMLTRIKNKKKMESIAYPWDGLNKLSYGIRKSELVMFTAPTGIGKTQIMREIAYSIHKQKPDTKIGTLFLEESPEESNEGLMSVHANIPFHLPDSVYTDNQHTQAFNEVLLDGKFFFYEAFGSNNIDNIISRIRYYAKGLDCEYIILDHLSIIVSDQQNGDERKALDEISTKLKTLTIELNICILAVVHLNRNGQIRGTAGIEQLSNIIIHIDRDLKSDNKDIRNTSTLTIWKNRFSGKTGVACYLKYDEVTGRMNECNKPDGDI